MVGVDMNSQELNYDVVNEIILFLKELIQLIIEYTGMSDIAAYLIAFIPFVNIAMFFLLIWWKLTGTGNNYTIREIFSMLLFGVFYALLILLKGKK